jgi:hypothetical protein
LIALAPVSGHAGAAIAFKTRSGQVVSIPDFTTGRTPSYSEPGTSYYHLIDDAEVQSRGYQLQVSPGRVSKVTIALVKRPFGTTRRAAERELRKFFPLPNKTLCQLDIEVSIPGPVAPVLSAKTLGLSFCPAAVALP